MKELINYNSVGPPSCLINPNEVQIIQKEEIIPKGVKKEHWLKLQELRAKKDEISQKSKKTN